MFFKFFYINENLEVWFYGIFFIIKDLIGFLFNEDEDGVLSGVFMGNMIFYCVLVFFVLEIF